MVLFAMLAARTRHVSHSESKVRLCAGTYKASMVQAFQRTVKEARFAMVIVDAPNLSLDDLKMYWAAGQVSKHTTIHMQHLGYCYHVAFGMKSPSYR